MYELSSVQFQIRRLSGVMFPVLSFFPVRNQGIMCLTFVVVGICVRNLLWMRESSSPEFISRLSRSVGVWRLTDSCSGMYVCMSKPSEIHLANGVFAQ